MLALSRIELLLDLCCYAFVDEKRADIKERLSSSVCKLLAEDCTELYNYAAIQGITPFLLPYFKDGDFFEESPDDFLGFVIAPILSQERAYERRQKVMRKIVEMFTTDGLSVMFLKGATLSSYYPEPSHRICSDIDYYLFGENVKGDNILKKYGFLPKVYYHHHTHASIDGILIENHYDFLNRKDHKANRMLDDKLKALARKEGKTCSFHFADGSTSPGVYCMTPTMNSIFLIRHLSGHFASETVSFRHLYDVALFLRKDGDKVNWDMVLPLYEDCGMMLFVRILKVIIVERMGIPIETDCFPVEMEHGYITEKVWNSIISPAESNTYKRYSLRYLLRETKTFFDNRWKHELVYPAESYWMLIPKYGLSHIKRMLKRERL